MTPLECYRSNMIEDLYCHLSANLFKDNSDPLRRRIIIVPSHAIEDWLKKQLLEEYSICMGIEFIFLDRALQTLQINKENTISESALLTPFLENLIYSLKNKKSPLLKDILGNSCSAREISELAYQIAFLFSKYKLYAQNMILEWESLKDPLSLQPWLWQQLNIKKITSPLPKAEDFSKNIDLHIFGLSFIPPYIQQLMCKISEQAHVYQYIFSPCQLYWGDIQNKHEVNYQLKQCKNKKVSENELSNLEDLLADTNPLLANWGRLGRHQNNLIEDLSVKIHDSYYIHQQSDLPDLKKIEGEGNLLQQIQDDILTLHNPNEEIPRIITKNDNSIIIATAPSPHREIEVLYNNLMQQIEEHEEISQDEIIVMAPDIELYQPYIESVFGSEKSQLSFNFSDLGLQSSSASIELYLNFLSLSQKRWEEEEVFHILSQQDIYRKLGLCPESINSLRKNLKEHTIFWGKDSEHRRQVLPDIIETSDIGTWEGSIASFLEDIAINKTNKNLGLAQIHKLGEVIYAIRTIYNDLKPLRGENRLELSQWSEYHLKLLNTYFDINSDNENSYRKIKAFLQKNIQSKARSEKIYYTTFSLLMLGELQNSPQKRSIGTGVTFCSMVPMRAIPAHIISIIGLSESEFPRREIPQALNIMLERNDCDYHPTRIDYDRYLFLEALLSARKIFYCSYSKSLKDGSQTPSIIIQELLDYLEEAFNLERGNFVQRHPSLGYHTSYFHSESKYTNFLHKNLKLAELSQNNNSKNISFKRSSKNIPESNISVEALLAAAKNPTKLYFNKVLGIYLKGAPEKSCEFQVSPLNKYAINKESVFLAAEDVLNQASKKAHLPLGFFRELSTQQLQDELEPRQESFGAPSDIKPIIITFDSSFEEPLQKNSSHWILPSLIIGQKHITGTLDNLSTNGMLLYGKKNFVDIAKIWSSYLILLVALEKYDLNIKPQILCLKDGKIWNGLISNPIKELKNFILYHNICLQHCLPFQSNFFKDIIEDNFEGFSKKYQAKPFRPMGDINPYRTWLQDYNHLPEEKDLYQQCQPIITNAYKTLLGLFNRRTKK